MLEAVRNLLASDDDPDADAGIPEPEAVREAIEETEAELEEARERLSELQDEHREMLLAAPDEEIDEQEDRIAEAERTVARLEAARSALADRLEEAEEAAKLREAAAEAEEAIRLKEEGEELLEEWRALVRRGPKILERLREIEAGVAQRREAFRKSPDHDYAESVPPMRAASLGVRNPDPVEKTVLPPAGPDAPGWNSRNWSPPRQRREDAPEDGDLTEEEPVEIRAVEAGESEEGPLRRRTGRVG